jgi:hypothetical protein
MGSNTTFEIPSGKYNRWCERRPLVCSDKKRIGRANSYLIKKELTSSEKAALYLHDLVSCEGLEFVAFGNARLNEPVVLPGNIKLVPCFLPDVERKSLEDPIVQLTMQMVQRSRFIYDGWLPISNWQAEVVRKAIRKIDQALSIFALQGRVSFSWEPKYIPIDKSQPSSYHFEHRHIQEIEHLSHFAESLTDADSRALFRSVAWLSQSLKLTEPAARFLFSILAIESLVGYIEGESTDDSVFASLRSMSSHLTKPERKAQREECIKSTLDCFLNADPTKAISSAYFDCITGITQRLKAHLERVFVDDSASVDLLFNTKVEGKTLYDLRHDIAHGTADALSEAQREIIRARVWDAERVARRYIAKVLESVTNKSLFVQQMTASLYLPVQNSVISNERMYRGPTHMAQIYALR